MRRFRRFLILLGAVLTAAVVSAHEDGPAVQTVRLVLPEGLAAPTAVHVSPDTLRFGGQAIVAVDFPAGTVLPAPADLSFEPGHLGVQAADRVLPPADAFPPADGERLLLSVRAYALGPLAVAAGEAAAPALTVLGLVVDPSETAPVRGPRVWGVPFHVLALAALIPLLLAALGWWLWTRRRRLDPLTQWDVADPAWLRAAVDLEILLQDGRLDRGDTRSFLDDLAAIMRRFLADRYRVSATAATGRDLRAACTRLGHPPDQSRTFARLLDAVDSLRYGPETAGDASCREVAGEFLNLVDTVRILPRFTPVLPAKLLRAEQAWSRLQGIPWLGAAPTAVGEET